MSVEFIGYVGTQEVSEIIPPSGPTIDTDYARRVLEGVKWLYITR